MPVLQEASLPPTVDEPASDKGHQEEEGCMTELAKAAYEGTVIPKLQIPKLNQDLKSSPHLHSLTINLLPTTHCFNPPEGIFNSTLLFPLHGLQVNVDCLKLIDICDETLFGYKTLPKAVLEQIDSMVWFSSGASDLYQLAPMADRFTKLRCLSLIDFRINNRPELRKGLNFSPLKRLVFAFTKETTSNDVCREEWWRRFISCIGGDVEIEFQVHCEAETVPLLPAMKTLVHELEAAK
jgi:hypothetical protein